VVKAKIALPRCPYFQAKIDDFPLKCCINWLNMKTNIPGSNIARNPPQNPIRGWRFHHDLIKASSET
jgi:hypothetical protein